MRTPCRICGVPSAARALCETHYSRWKRLGDPRADVPKRQYGSAVERLWAGMSRDENGCWIWRRTRNNNGYGMLVVDGRRVHTHRYAYEVLVEPIPKGMQLDHLCRVPACCNPAHLEIVTPRENYLRGMSPPAQNARKTHCPRGHPYDESNTGIGSKGERRCRACGRERAQRIRDEKKRHVDEHGGGRIECVFTEKK